MPSLVRHASSASIRAPLLSRITTVPVFSLVEVDTGLLLTPARIVRGLGDGELRSAGDGDGSGVVVADSIVTGVDGDGVGT